MLGPKTNGNVLLFLFGCRYPDDILNVAFLDNENDQYHFEVHAPGFEYKVRGPLATADAFREAEDFIHCSFHFDRSRNSSILDPDGHVIGYEVRPLYSLLRFGMSDVMNIEYRMNESKVVIFIKLDPAVEFNINDQGRDKGREGVP